MSRLISLVAAVCVIAWMASETQSQNGPVGGDIPNGMQIFRFDTFGDEQLWTNELRMQRALEDLSPETALSVGLKVDSEALPASVINDIKAGLVNLKDPGVTLQLLKLNAVVGVIGKVVGQQNNLVTVGITCALCHSTVDDSIAQGIGKRRDGWPNLDLNVGAIVALSPTIDDKTPYLSWGRGKYDPRFHAFDGRRIITLNTPTLPVVIPPIYGLQNVGFETFTGDGPISYWNNYVGVTQMGGRGDFTDLRIGLRIFQRPDLVKPKLPELLAYQLTLAKPAPPPGSFDPAAAARGEMLFMGAARCSTCHIPPTYTDVHEGPSPIVPLLHNPSETKVDGEYAKRSATQQYRTTPLRALWQHPPYFHDGSAASLLDVVNHYNTALPNLNLTEAQKMDLVAFLKSL